MGEDWREFRAKLVAREHVEEMGIDGSLNQSSSNKSSKKKDEGGILGALSSIFKKDDQNNKKSNSAQGETDKYLGLLGTKSSLSDTDKRTNIFDGVDVGGATKFSKIEVEWDCSDPFMDDEECHLIYDESDVQLDKHRWAHPLFHVEPGCILVANEKLVSCIRMYTVIYILGWLLFMYLTRSYMLSACLQGGVFHQTVVLIIDHNEATGSTGMVINRCVSMLSTMCV